MQYRFHRRAAALLTSLLISGAIAHADPDRVTVKVNEPGVAISPTFYGLMTEEINHSYDGGLYAELIQNRAFKDNEGQPAHWSAVGGSTITLDKTQPIGGTALTTCLHLDIPAAGAGVANDGYWGVPATPGTRYDVSFYAKAAPGFSGSLQAAIVSDDGQIVLAKAKVSSISGEWRKYTVSFKTARIAASAKNHFVITADRPGTVWLNQVSLFPPTFNHRANGDRIDLTKALAEMKPSFLRMPGGNYLEGNAIAERFNWKETIGDVDKRPGHQGPWGYRSSDGFGLTEFLGWCDDLHMNPVLAVYAGYSLNGEHVEPGPALQPYVQDALDEIEYVTGGPETKWGAERIRNGHPAPYPLTYVEIGNEDGGDQSGSYPGRYAQFYDAIKAKYPKLQVMATANVTTRKPDIVDDHYYRTAADMERDATHYDDYDRTGPKIFVGEWASTEGNPTPTLQAALGDAAWLTGLERNSDLVVMEAYAPLLVDVNPGGSQWGTNLIGFDALSSFGSPSYYMQSLFAKNTGDVVLPAQVSVTVPVAAIPPAHGGGIGVGTWRTDSEYRDIEVTQNGATVYHKDFATGSGDWKLGRGDWKVEDGALRQSSDQADTLATAGDTGWGDYTYHLQARKMGGNEGFFVVFHHKDDRNYWRWNIGGWNDSRTVLQRVEDGATDEIGKSAPVTVETGRWYDIRIELHAGTVRCYLDDKLVQEATEAPRPAPAPVYVAASETRSNGDLFLKVVNVSANAMPLEIDLQGAKDVSPKASGWVLTGNPQDVNSIAEPLKVAPTPITISDAAPRFTHEFPAHSVTVLKLRVGK